jgi:protein arginine N-methyltransferase 5
MENYNPSEDPGPAFCVGHHEHNRMVTVTPRVIQNVHESNVGPCFPLMA